MTTMTGRKYKTRQREPETKHEMNLMRLIEEFDSEDKCRDLLVDLRWPDGVRCPRCDHDGISNIYSRALFECQSCSYQFSATVGTMFEDTHLPLRKWFIAAYLMIEGRKGVSSNQLKRTIDVSYKTAWHLTHRIRAAMQGAYPQPLKGMIEIDETYTGGKTKGMGHGYTGNKTLVVGMLQRGGKIRLQVVSGRDQETLQAWVAEHSSDDTEVYFTDEWAGYNGIADGDTRHETVNHSIGEYARGDVTTNGIEGVWALLKRSIMGAYHHLSAKHLNAYLDELEWRYNNRDNPWLFRDTLLRLLNVQNLPYRDLVAE